MRDRLFIDNLSTLIRKYKGESIMRKKVLLTTVIGTSLLLAACSSNTVSVKNEPVTLQSTIEETKATEEEAEDKMVMTTAAQVVEETTAIVEETTAAESGELKAYQQDCFDGVKYDYDHNDESAIPLSKSFRDYLDSIKWDINVTYISSDVLDPEIDGVCYDGWAFRLTNGPGANFDENMIYDIMRHAGEEFGILVNDASFDWRSFLSKNKDSLTINNTDMFEKFIDSPMKMELGEYIIITPDFIFTMLEDANNGYGPWRVLFSINKDGSCADTEFID